MQTAVVTGASSGLGREFVNQIYKKEKLDSIWVIARRENRLQEIAEKYRGIIRPIPLDLTKEESFSSLKAALEEEKPDIRILVNDAGFGKIGNYNQIYGQVNDDMIDLNCKALVKMTLLCLPYMQKGARILEISSSSAFQPLPAMNMYASTKAFVLSYSRGLRWELFERGIHVTAVCPYWIKDTEFIPISKDTANGNAVKHFLLASTAATVAKRALWFSKYNFPVATTGVVSFIQRLSAKIIPRELLSALWQVIRQL
jgi:hypothetical protein